MFDQVLRGILGIGIMILIMGVFAYFTEMLAEILHDLKKKKK